MTGVIGHAGETLDHRRDPRQSPQIRRKPMRAGSFAERVIDARQLGRRQFRFPPRSPGSVQRISAYAADVVFELFEFLGYAGCVSS